MSGTFYKSLLRFTHHFLIFYSIVLNSCVKIALTLIFGKELIC